MLILQKNYSDPEMDFDSSELTILPFWGDHNATTDNKCTCSSCIHLLIIHNLFQSGRLKSEVPIPNDVVVQS